MEKNEYKSIAANDMDKCATIYRKDPSSFVYVCYHCGASFNDIECTLQHVESHFRLVQATIDENPLKSENIDNTNSTDTHLSTRHITDATDQEFYIKTEIMESEEDCDDGLLNNIRFFEDPKIDIKAEAMESEEEDIELSTPKELIEPAASATQKILTPSSKERYGKMYNEFTKWRNSKNKARISQTVLMAYFNELAQKHQPPTLWAYYSMLKATIKINDNIDISSYQQLSAFLKTKASGYKPVKAKVFSEADIHKFIDEAPDELWLDVKVACIFGVAGACRAHELPRIKLKDIESHGDLLLVRILKSNDSIIDRTFTITGKYRTIVQKYAALRTADMTEDRFFVNYQRGKCTRQFIGKNKLANMPRRIAKYLQLPEPDRFTGLSFRLANPHILKLSGSRRSNEVADEYVDHSIRNKRQDHNPSTMTATNSKTFTFSISENVMKVINISSIENKDEKNSHGIFGK